MNYRKIDIDTWERRDLFKLYTTDLKIVMNMTVDVDVTEVEGSILWYPGHHPDALR